MQNLDEIISNNTKNNWKRLNSNKKDKLKQRANKILSEKKFIPVECIKNKKNKKTIDCIIKQVQYKNFEIKDVIYTLGYRIYEQNFKKNKYAKEVIEKFKKSKNAIYLKTLFDVKLKDEDLLGIVYQSLRCEGEKSEYGAYFTPPSIVLDMLYDVNLKNEDILDMACGSGSFLLQLNLPPERIYGMDIDEISIFISNINLYLKYPDYNGFFNLYVNDFLQNNELDGKKFDYIISNPPWGAKIYSDYNYYFQVKTKESFSLFLQKAFTFLKENGELRFLFPGSVLNVKIHKSIRKFILENTNLYKIKRYTSKFTKVQSEVVAMYLKNSDYINDTLIFVEKNCENVIDKSFYKFSKNNVFNNFDEIDNIIIKKVYSRREYTLKSKDFAMGIVTGDNKSSLSEFKKKGYIPIYTGKDIEKYKIHKNKFYIEYNKNKLQQVANDNYYNCNEKLIYKFISNELCFAYDDKKRILLNSVNLVIPNIPNMSIKTVMAFLNSRLYNYLYKKLFNEIKILKGNLMLLPFPKISTKQNEEIENIVNEILLNKKIKYNQKKIDDIINKIFKLNEKELDKINRL